jgi:uncharacterized protein (DUF2252 family)
MADRSPTASSNPADEAVRFETFGRLAERVAAGDFVMLPRGLARDDRRLHVRQTIREDHRTRITNRDIDARAKFDKLADSAFDFFRGTALLFYRDLAGEDAWMPTVLALGDVHPGNFGVMPNADNVPIFAVNDFDEATYAPFTWDLKRGAVGFMIAAGEEGGHGAKRQRKIAKRFVLGYLDAISEFAERGTEGDHEIRLDNAPELIRDLIEDSMESREKWLRDDYLDEYGRGFRTTDELVPQTVRRDEFQDLVAELAAQMSHDLPERAGELRVKDVAIRRGQGTASLGLDRFYVLIDGSRGDGSDDLVLEFKQARRSALAGLDPSHVEDFTSPGERITHAHSVQLVAGDVFYGHVEIDGQSFMTRERAPYRGDIDLDDLSKAEWKTYAGICGRVLAHAHALSDDLGTVDHDIEPEIVAAVGQRDLFVDDIVRFAAEACERLRGDHRSFVADHALCAFEQVDQHFH